MSDAESAAIDAAADVLDLAGWEYMDTRLETAVKVTRAAVRVLAGEQRRPGYKSQDERAAFTAALKVLSA